MTAYVEWPVEVRGVTESVVATLGPNDRWNLAALGLFEGDPVTARTWGRTRTWRNFRERGEGYVQFTTDPVDFVDAACSIREAEDPILDSADAWARVEVEPVDEGGAETTDGAADTDVEDTDETTVVEWALRPVERAVVRRVVPTTNRAYYAVVEATVAVSRLDVPEYDADELRDRITYLESVVERCGGSREREAFDRLREHAELGT